ncbi:hypothetical protein CAPTEDRAFT_204923 [Capitella teleta]|uniref:C2H2-type domain-containing protein n=1 Tax=Capitella teleta TaxID=283909 RepID=R7TMU9_CAPTE|nr:hypothetical protein CAPTEDRAFT_204923 [Capitella teleta]|eukprot:ELT92876.1 hypothetical protein CAPTEDRAFT_204923 [Capitella teleta]
MVPPPLPGKQITDRTESIVEASLKSLSDYPHTSAAPQIADNKVQTVNTDEFMDKERVVHRKRKKTRDREEAALLQGTDIARRYYQCKYCTFLTNYYPVIIQHGSTKHSKYRELLCTYCKYKLVDNAHIKFHYNTQHPGIPVNVHFSKAFNTIPPSKPPIKKVTTRDENSHLSAMSKDLSGSDSVLSGPKTPVMEKNISTTPADMIVCETQFPKDKCLSLKHPLISSVLAEPCPTLTESEPGTSSKNCRETTIAHNSLSTKKLEFIRPAGDNHLRMNFGAPRHLMKKVNPTADFANPSQKVLNSSPEIVVQPASVKDNSKELVLLSGAGQQNEESDPPQAFSLVDKQVTQLTTVDKYFCHFCNFSASEKEPMVDHLDVHNIDYFFTCARCPGRKYKKFMIEHMRDSHPGCPSDLCSLVDETKFFEFKHVENSSSEVQNTIKQHESAMCYSGSSRFNDKVSPIRT